MAPRSFRLTETQQATLRTLLRVVQQQCQTPAAALAQLVEGADFDRTERETLLRWCRKAEDADKRLPKAPSEAG